MTRHGPGGKEGKEMKQYKASNKIFLAIILALTLVNLSPSFTDTINYTYDGLNRLIRVENATSGSVVEYQYDAVGNRTQKQTNILTGKVQFQVRVRKDAENVLQGIDTYLFNESGSYLDLTQVTDATGVVRFNVSRGKYKLRADYVGYQFWSDTVQVTAATSIDLTIPHHSVGITVNSTFQGTTAPLSGITVYLFSPSNSYLGLSQKTGGDGRVSFSLPDKDYKVRADHLGRQYFSPLFNAQDTVVNIPMADAEITVIQGGQAISAINVHAFTPSSAYLGITGTTNASGKVIFRLPAAAYRFRADYLGNQYWSPEEALVADQLKPITINMGGGSFTVTVRKGESDPLIGANCYAFTAAGSYLDLSRTTNNNGMVSYSLTDGSYKFRIDYLGSQFWTDIVTVPATMSITKTIAHQSVTVTVMGTLAGSVLPKPGVPVYLFSSSGSYLSLQATTDGTGRAAFNLPQQSYKVRADYLGQQFWLDLFTWEDKTVLIPEGTAHIHITMAGQDIQGVLVYIFNSAGSYLGLSGTTNASGIIDFHLPAGIYKFRADYQGSQYWITAGINQDLVNTAELSMGGGQFTLAIDKGSEPLAGVRTYVYNPSGSYLAMYNDSNTNGRVSFNLSSGSYKFRVDHLGYQFWSDVFNVPNALSGTLSIPHLATTITIEGVYQGAQPIAGVNVYLFTPSGSYLSKTQVTNSSGQVTFVLPNKGYKVRADYLGTQFWSDAFQFQNATVSIPRGVARIMARKGGNPVSGVPVYLFSSSGSYLGLNGTTNTDGNVEFLLPNRSYKFRVDAGGVQYWSAVTAITEGQVNLIEVNWN
jgi:YD repeat-containing protein